MKEGVQSTRIWVALDALERSELPLAAALGLARALQAELAALFVENVDLFRVAAFPQAFETRLFGASGGGAGAEGLEAALRAQASVLERQLGRAAGASGIRWSFRTARGRVVQQALELAGEGECVVLPGAAVATSLVIARPSTQVRSRAETGPGRRAEPADGGPTRAIRPPAHRLWALPGVGARAHRVLEIGQRLLAGGEPGRLVMPDDPGQAQSLRDWLRQRGWQNDWRETSLAALQAARRQPGTGAMEILLVPRPLDSAERAAFEAGPRRTGWPIVLV